MSLAFALNLVLLGTLCRGVSDGTSDSCYPLCVPRIYWWHYPSHGHVSWTTLDTSSLSLHPRFKHSNLLLRPVYLSSCLSFLKCLLSSSVGQVWGEVLGTQQQVDQRASAAFSLGPHSLCYCDFPSIWTLSAQAPGWPLQQYPNWVSFLCSLTYQEQPSPKRGTKIADRRPPALLKSFLGSTLPAKVWTLPSDVMFLYGGTPAFCYSCESHSF